MTGHSNLKTDIILRINKVDLLLWETQFLIKVYLYRKKGSIFIMQKDYSMTDYSILGNDTIFGISKVDLQQCKTQFITIIYV